MASSYFPSWLHVPALSRASHIFKVAFYKPVPLGYFTLASAGVLSVAYVLSDVFWYFSIPKFERGPSTPWLYVQSCVIRAYRFIRGMDGTRSKPLYTFEVDAKQGIYKRKLLKEGDIPQRRGPRPAILIQGVPHRQIPQMLDPTLNTAVEDVLKSLAAERPDIVTLGPSKVEPNALAVFLSPEVSPFHPDLKNSLSRGLEFAHVHESENSLHLALAPLDAAQAIEKGWAVRFPLAGCPIKGYTHPQGRLLVYAPRDKSEVDVVRSLVLKALEWMMQKP